MTAQRFVRRSLLPLVLLLLSASRAPASPGSLRLRKGDRIVALGDSITQAGGYLELMRSVFQKHYPGLGIEVLNAGISGNKSPDMLARLDKDVIDQNPSIVTVSCGVNDVWHGFYTPPRGVDLETYGDTMGQIVDYLRRKTRAEIYLLTPTVIHENLESPENQRLEAYCQVVRQLAEDKRCRLVDLNDLFNLALRAAQIGGAPNFHPTTDGVHMKPSGDFLMGAAILRELGVPMSRILERTQPPPVEVQAHDPRIQLWGRWDMRKAETTGAVTVNTGSTILVRFEGTGLTFHFQTSHYPLQLPSLWLKVDEGDWKEVSPRESLPLSLAPLREGEHLARMVVKGFREWDRRWDPPLESSIVFRGVSLAPGGRVLDPPARPARLIEYLGDNITEGVLVLTSGPRQSWKPERWPQYSDGLHTWAYQSALEAEAEPRTVGFGRLGLSIHGNGGVPPAIYSFPGIYGGAPLDTQRLPDAVVINLGTNDGSVKPEVFAALYRAYLETVRKQYPRAHLFCLRPFNGAHAEVINETAKALAAAGDGRIHYVDTAGWIEKDKHTTDGIHLNLEGHRVAGEKMAAILKENR